MSVPVIRPENLIYFLLSSLTVPAILGENSEKKLQPMKQYPDIYKTFMSRIIIIGEMLYHQLLRQSMFPLIIKYRDMRDMIHIVTTTLEWVDWTLGTLSIVKHLTNSDIRKYLTVSIFH